MKKLFIFLSLILFTVSIASCSKKNNNDNETFTVRFADDLGRILQKNQVKKGDTAVYTGETPTKSSIETSEYIKSYIFSNWDKPLENIQADTTFYAVFTELIKYKEHQDSQYVNYIHTMISNLKSSGAYEDGIYGTSLTNEFVENGMNTLSINYDTSSDELYFSYTNINFNDVNKGAACYIILSNSNNNKYKVEFVTKTSSGARQKGYGEFNPHTFYDEHDITFYSYSGEMSQTVNEYLCGLYVKQAVDALKSNGKYNLSILGFDNFC